jgi:DNA ligase-1
MITTNKAASIYAAIEKIAATSSKKEKDAMVADLMSLPLFVKIVRYAYDPFIVFGIEQIPSWDPSLARGGNTLDEASWWEMLDDLASRKLSGMAARDAVQKAVNFLDEASGALFVRIIRKDLRAGFSEGTINRVKPGLIPDFPYMRCSLPPKSNMAKWDWSVGIISQEKADGMFANANVDKAGVVWITSRQGSPFPAGCMSTLEAGIKEAILGGHQLHGELVVYEDGQLMPREKGNGVLNSLLSGGALEANQEVRYFAWDMIPLESVKTKGKCNTPYQQRLVGLLRLLKGTGLGAVKCIPTRIVKSKEDAFAHYTELLKQGKEGTILKHPSAIWEDKTSKDQVKLKLEVDVDLKVTGFVPGREGTKNEGRIGSITVESACGQLRTDVTVKNEKLRDKLDSEDTRNAWLDSVLVVRANSIMMPSESNDLHSLFLPRMVEDDIRADKSQADDLARVKLQFEAAKTGATV